MAGSSSAIWQLGVSRMRPPTILSNPPNGPISRTPAPPVQLPWFLLFHQLFTAIGLPDASHRPSPDPQLPIFSTAGYVGAATVGAAAWWFLYAEDGPHVTYSQLVGRLKRENGGGWEAEGGPRGLCRTPVPSPPPADSLHAVH